MSKKPKASKNKASDVKMSKLDKLWIDYGKLRAEKDRIEVALKQVSQQILKEQEKANG